MQSPEVPLKYLIDMKRHVFAQVVKEIEAQNVWDFDECLDNLVEHFPGEKPETLRSIVSQT